MITSSHGAHQGLTLIELLVVMAMVAITTTIAVPSFQNFIQNNRLITVANELVSSLTLARSMAISQRAPTIVCRSANATAAAPLCGGDGNWEDGWIVFSDLNGDNAYTPPNEPLWQQRGPAPALVEIGAGANVDPMVRFAPIGTAPGFNGTFAVCDDRKGEARHVSRMREVVVSVVGRVRASDGDGGTACPS